MVAARRTELVVPRSATATAAAGHTRRQASDTIRATAREAGSPRRRGPAPARTIRHRPPAARTPRPNIGVVNSIAKPPPRRTPLVEASFLVRYPLGPRRRPEHRHAAIGAHSRLGDDFDRLSHRVRRVGQPRDQRDVDVSGSHARWGDLPTTCLPVGALGAGSTVITKRGDSGSCAEPGDPH